MAGSHRSLHCLINIKTEGTLIKSMPSSEKLIIYFGLFASVMVLNKGRIPGYT